VAINQAIANGERMTADLRIFGLCMLSCALLTAPTQLRAAGPNIIHILADDLGYGSVGFNGQLKIQTPNLDALASGGMKFTSAYSCPTCAAARSTLYTGFNTGHANVDGNSELTAGFNADEIMTGTVLKQAGYNTAVFGKWGFGATGSYVQNGPDNEPTISTPASLPNNHGVDTFYGFLNHSAAQDYFYQWMWKTQTGAPNGLTTVANNLGPPNATYPAGSPEYTHDLIAKESEKYITAHAADSSPFFMELNYTIPHFDITQISSAPGGLGIYSGAAYSSWTTEQKQYAAMITRMDASVGSLMAKLSNPDGIPNTNDSILNNTLVIFTSDNGADGEAEAPRNFFTANAPFRGGKFEIYEGGIHMPEVAYWNGTIAPGSVSNYRTDLADFMATAADLAGVDTPVGVDGTSLKPILTGQGPMKQRDYLVFEQHGIHGDDADSRVGRWTVIRQDGMKLIRYDNETQELYNLNTDPDENAPLSLANPTNLAIAQELEADAIADDVTRGAVQYHKWTGPNGGSLESAGNWGATTAPDRYWSAVVANTGASPAIAHVATDVTTLGVEVKGSTAMQVVNVHSGRTLTSLNEVRVGNHGRIDLADGTVASSRWVNIKAGGQVIGQGTVKGDVYNQGTVSPGRTNDTPAWPVAPPPALPPSGLNTGTVTAMAFNFSGVQDEVPVNQTTTLSPYVELTHGLDFGPSIGPRWSAGGTDAGNELNAIGFNATSLSQAITNGDYITFSVDPVAGAGIIPDSVSFRFWRNGNPTAGTTGSPPNFAILSDVKGFTAGDVLAQATYSDFTDRNHDYTAVQHTLTAPLPTVTAAIDGPTEYRLYAWGATNPASNIHVNAVSLSAKFVGVPSLEFNFSGVQNQGPLTALKRKDANVTLASGLTYGPGLNASSNNNAGNELNVAGFSTGSTQQSALDGNDYLTFTVQAVTGMTMIPDSASFTIWRQSQTSATGYALFSSATGFSAGQQLAQASINAATIGAAAQLAIEGTISSPQPTTSPVEFRLYGWGAGSSLDNTHVTAASMRARFASIVGVSIDPTGSISVQGDFYHQAGGQIAIDLGGRSAGVDYDTINVVGKVNLAGDLSVSLADAGGSPFAPVSGDLFQILTATQGLTGQFANVALPTLPWDLNWKVNYFSTAVTLSVIVTGDFDHDGFVNTSDYVVWRKNNGSVADYNAWRANFGTVLGSGSGVGLGSSNGANVPEPTSFVLLITGAAFFGVRRRRRGQADGRIRAAI
jgi:arylsulfatase A